MTEYFHNPYNFVPAPPVAFEKEDGLGQRAPVGHAHFAADCWNGRIQIEITARTPLMLPDPSTATAVEVSKRSHITTSMMTDNRGAGGPRPYLPPTSLKGTLRSAYEAITNSRLSVFSHRGRISRRFQAPEALRLVPARVSDNGNALELLLGPHGTYEIADDRTGLQKVLPRKSENKWAPADNVPYAAILPTGPGKKTREKIDAIVSASKAALCEIQEYRHTSSGRRGSFTRTYLEVSRIRSEKSDEGDPNSWDIRLAGSKNDSHERLSEPYSIKAYIHMTGANIRGKKHERAFFASEGPVSIPFDEIEGGRSRVAELWRDVIRDYRRVAEYNSLPKGALRSRHISNKHASERLEPGTLFYVMFAASEQPAADKTVSSDPSRIEGVYPVLIGRQLSDERVGDLLPPELLPAESKSELSAADRVFGWIAGAESSARDRAHKGQLRIADVRCESGSFMEFGDDGLALAPLSTPQPQQARFYAASDRMGTPVIDGADLGDVFYRPGQGLRGRKISITRQNEPQQGWAEAIRHPAPDPKLRVTPVNRSVRNLVGVGTRFIADIEVTNLHAAELGALLWLLDLPQQAHSDVGDPLLRVGGGKPFGLGAVAVTLRSVSLSNGAHVGKNYRKVFGPRAEQIGFSKSDTDGRAPSPEAMDSVRDLIDGYRSEIAARHGGDFYKASFIRAFLNAARGVSGDISYPRVIPPQPTPGSNQPPEEIEGYSWFIANEGGGNGPRYALPSLFARDGEPDGLEILPGHRPRKKGRRN